MTKNELEYFFDYDKFNGVFYRKNPTNKKLKIGETVGSVTKKGYLKTNINGNFYFIHRLVWLHETGEMPNGIIDHINCDKKDNRFENLRIVTSKQNSHNRNKANSSNKSSGLLGVTWNKQYGKWQSRIMESGKAFLIGLFDDKNDAHSAYLDAKSKIHKIEAV